ncbi:MAG: XRE family transcriptional regulators [Treponematales bacterium]
MSESDLRAVLSVNLKRYRRFRGLTQAEFAAKIDISIPFLSDIENGKKWVSPYTLVKMAGTLNIEVYELLKPEKLLPDSSINIVEKYTADIYARFDAMLHGLRDDYIAGLSAAQSS